MQTIIKKITSGFLIVFNLLPFVSNAQNKPPTCADIKNGIFYYYPKNSADRFVDIREGELAHETNTSTGDTSLWQIKWTDDCTYALKYIAGNGKMPGETLTFLKKHKLVFRILNVTNDYYVFKGYADNTSNLPLVTDTMWLNERINVVSNELFKQIQDNLVLRRSHFSDTSRYAVVYVYRPGKFTNSLGNYLIYFNDNIMCVAKNRSGYIFKILKEGQFQVKSKLNKDESSVQLNVKFGNTYYIKSMIHWGIYSLSRNYKLEMAIADPAEGKSEFEEVDLQQK